MLDKKNIGQDLKSNLIDRMKSGPVSISTDGSNDEKSKQFPLVVRTVGQDGLVNSELLAVPVVKGSATGENIFHVIEKVLSAHQIPRGKTAFHLAQVMRM